MTHVKRLFLFALVLGASHVEIRSSQLVLMDQLASEYKQLRQQVKGLKDKNSILGGFIVAGNLDGVSERNLQEGISRMQRVVAENGVVTTSEPAEPLMDPGLSLSAKERAERAASEALGEGEKSVTPEFESAELEYRLSIQKMQDIMNSAGVVCSHGDKSVIISVEQAGNAVSKTFVDLVDVAGGPSAQKNVKTNEFEILVQLIQNFSDLLEEGSEKKEADQKAINSFKNCFSDDLNSAEAMSFMQNILSIELGMAKKCFHAIPDVRSKQIFVKIDTLLRSIENLSANLSDWDRAKTALDVISKRFVEGKQESVAFVNSLDIEPSLAQLIEQLIALTFKVQALRSCLDLQYKIKDANFYKNNIEHQKYFETFLQRKSLSLHDTLNSWLLKILHSNNIIRVTADDVRMIFDKLETLGTKDQEEEAKMLFGDKISSLSFPSYLQGYLQGLLLINPAAVESLDESEVAKLLRLLQKVDAQMPTAVL
ncbi:hypothetical protein KBD08_04365 [Candidatus Babeliales bacterium]|nr:hypothetical protein [Candidatus Babeliales bacterium]